MFIGHLALGFAAKRAAPRVSLAVLFSAAQLADIRRAIVALDVWEWTPLLFLILGSFSPARLPSEFSFASLSLSNYAKVWRDPGTYAVFSNTLLFACGSTALGVVIAASLAWLVERTDMPAKIWVYGGVPMTLAMPGMLISACFGITPRSGS